MPKSKREKLVHLTKTQKQGRARKETLIESVRKSLDEFSSVYVFEYGNLRTNFIKDVRMVWNTSRFFMGRNRVMQVALGQDANSAVRDEIHHLSKRLGGQRGLLFTNADKEDVKAYFGNFHATDYARGGYVPEATVTLPAGPLQAVPSMEPLFRKLGLPTELKNGVVMLREDYEICEKGKTLTVEQAKLLKLFEMPIAHYRLKLVCLWSGAGYESLMDDEEEGDEESEEAEEGEDNEADNQPSDDE